MPLLHTAVTPQVLATSTHEAMVDHPGAGAMVCFTGVIRDHDPEAKGEVVGIEYSHHPDADALLATMVARFLAAADPQDEARVAVSHRVGHLDVGELALVCAVSTPHRAQAFELCSGIVEMIKHELPIWKHQREADGRTVWSGLGLAGEQA